MVDASFTDILVNKKFYLAYTCLEYGFIGSYQRWIRNQLNNGFVSKIQGGMISNHLNNGDPGFPQKMYTTGQKWFINN